MNIVLLIAVIALMTTQNTVSKIYTLKYSGSGVFFYSCLCCGVAAVFFILTAGGKPEFCVDYLPYSAGFAAAYGTGMLFSVMALKFGSMAVTALVISYSLIIPALFGIVMYKEPVSLFLVIGLVLLCASLALIKDKDNDKIRINVKWIICALLAFLGNGFCSSIQQMQQRNFDGKYKSEFMIVALIIIVVILLILSLIYERKHIVPMLKKGLIMPVISGFANGSMNLVVMFLVLQMSSSVAFPLISAGGIVATAAVSVFGYKEKLTRRQIYGLILGILSIVFMNI